MFDVVSVCLSWKEATLQWMAPTFNVATDELHCDIHTTTFTPCCGVQRWELDLNVSAYNWKETALSWDSMCWHTWIWISEPSPPEHFEWGFYAIAPTGLGSVCEFLPSGGSTYSAETSIELKIWHQQSAGQWLDRKLWLRMIVGSDPFAKILHAIFKQS